MGSQSEVGVDSKLERLRLLLLELSTLRARDRAVDIGEERAPPEVEGPAQRCRRFARLLASSLVHEPLESLDVDGSGLDGEHVAGGSRDDRVASQRLAHLGDMHLEGRRRGVRRGAVPELVDQTVARDHPVRMQHEEREERSLLRAPYGKRTVVLERFQRAEDSKLDARRRLL